MTFTEPTTGANIYRIYNPKSGEHLFTNSAYEKNVRVSEGWRNEGVAFHSGGNVPVYRLYNPHAGVGAHLDTANANEKKVLQSRGWKYEGVAWYALSQGVVGTSKPSTGLTQNLDPNHLPQSFIDQLNSGYLPALHITSSMTPFQIELTMVTAGGKYTAHCVFR